MDERKGYTCDKAELRRMLVERRAGLADKPELSYTVAQKVLSLVSGNVMVYVSIGSELDTYGLIRCLFDRKDVKVYAPFTVNGVIVPRPLVKLDRPNNIGNLPEECYGQAENAENDGIFGEILDFCLTPLLGFNSDGFRIGYGKGCYDRYFAEHACKKRIGLAFECQRVNFTPDPHDMPLDCCVTERKVLYFKS